MIQLGGGSGPEPRKLGLEFLLTTHSSLLLSVSLRASLGPMVPWPHYERVATHHLLCGPAPPRRLGLDILSFSLSSLRLGRLDPQMCRPVRKRAGPPWRWPSGIHLSSRNCHCLPAQAGRDCLAERVAARSHKVAPV